MRAQRLGTGGQSENPCGGRLAVVVRGRLRRHGKAVVGSIEHHFDVRDRSPSVIVDKERRPVRERSQRGPRLPVTRYDLHVGRSEPDDQHRMSGHRPVAGTHGHLSRSDDGGQTRGRDRGHVPPPDPPLDLGTRDHGSPIVPDPGGELHRCPDRVRRADLGTDLDHRGDGRWVARGQTRGEKQKAGASGAVHVHSPRPRFRGARTGSGRASAPQ